MKGWNDVPSKCVLATMSAYRLSLCSIWVEYKYVLQDYSQLGQGHALWTHVERVDQILRYLLHPSGQIRIN